MLPPRLVRRLVLAPLAIVIAIAIALLFPLLALLALIFGLLSRSRPGRMRSVRLLYFALIWLGAETVALFTCLGLWVASGFGGRLRTEPYQSRHYAIMRRFLDRVYRSATSTFRVRVEVIEPELTGAEQAARLDRPVIVLSRHAGPGDSFLLVHDVLANRLPNVFIHHRRAGERFYTEQIERLAHGLDQAGALVIFPEGGNWTPGRWR